jgi:hypothetical protein
MISSGVSYLMTSGFGLQILDVAPAVVSSCLLSSLGARWNMQLLLQQASENFHVFLLFE